MSSTTSSLLSLKKLDQEKMLSLFQRAQQLKNQPGPIRAMGETLALLFFEPSTRTRLSFQTAGARMGLQGIVLESAETSSLSKGETIEDTILNVASLQPKLIVIRSGDELDMQAISKAIAVPIINGGWGSRGHPTQALLDIFTLYLEKGDLNGQKLLFVGDLIHSRVFSSHLELASKLGIELGCISIPGYVPEIAELKYFSTLKDGLGWADAVMALRFQFERHTNGVPLQAQEYHRKYGLNADSLKDLTANALIMHPGPVNHGIEVEPSVFSDPRCRILDQVANGVFLREALMRSLLGWEVNS